MGINYGEIARAVGGILRWDSTVINWIVLWDSKMVEWIGWWNSKVVNWIVWLVARGMECIAYCGIIFLDGKGRE